MTTVNSDILPNQPGIDLGSPDQRFTGFFDDLDVAGDLNAAGVIIATGNATKLQGNPVSSNTPALNQALIWDGSAWTPTNQSGSGGGGATLGYVITSFSATPAFTPSPAGSCTFKITLTGNVTSSTFTTAGLTAGALIKFYVIQDATGSRTFQWPSVCALKPSIGSSPNQTTVQGFVFDGTNLQPDGMAVSYP